VIYHLSGKLVRKGDGFVVIAVGGVGFKIAVSNRLLSKLPAPGEEIFLYSHLYVREDALELYGFDSPEELNLFELLNSVAGVGPKSALAILELADYKSVAAAIKEGRPDVLTRASGIGRKTAERIVLELRHKVEAELSPAELNRVKQDADLMETLVGLGYRRDDVRAALAKVGSNVGDMAARLKEALKILSGRET
jgi:Holliday junction DNA helicase RuvA